jgi:hypothetical protein
VLTTPNGEIFAVSKNVTKFCRNFNFFWVVTLWFLVESYQRLGGCSAYHIYGKLLTALLIFLKMEAACVVEPPVYFYQTVGYPILEGGRPRSHSDEILRCRQLHGRLYSRHVRWAILKYPPAKVPCAIAGLLALGSPLITAETVCCNIKERCSLTRVFFVCETNKELFK